LCQHQIKYNKVFAAVDKFQILCAGLLMQWLVIKFQQLTQEQNQGIVSGDKFYFFTLLLKRWNLLLSLSI